MPTSQDPDGVGATAANAIGGSPRAPDINAHDNRGVAGAVGSATAAAVAGVTPAVDVMRMGSVPTTFLGTTVSALPHPVHMQPFGPGPALGVPSRQTPEQALAIARGVPSGVPAGGNELPVASSPGGVPSTQLPATPASAPGDGLPRLQLGTQVPSSVAQPPGGGVATPGAAALTGTSTRGGAPPAAGGTGQVAAITPRRATAPRPSAAELQRASPSSNSLMPNPLPAQPPRSRKRAASSPPARPSGRLATAVVPSSPTLLATELATSPPGLREALAKVVSDAVAKGLKDGLRRAAVEVTALRQTCSVISTTLSALSTSVNTQGVGNERTAVALQQLSGAVRGGFSSVMDKVEPGAREVKRKGKRVMPAPTMVELMAAAEDGDDGAKRQVAVMNEASLK
ncbi:hypothetical protein I4F81_007955 [Pyropia yezoensis]|uniref:Uncharacterized protein n=1 Tax=Pyropia yezoensis TaxID=2788 RepID=A0ACC3C5L6_PYRYE|nr:hypothetical protein I4F81_007955 [Neopyropia yezoensis]